MRACPLRWLLTFSLGLALVSLSGCAMPGGKPAPEANAPEAKSTDQPGSTSNDSDADAQTSDAQPPPALAKSPEGTAKQLTDAMSRSSAAPPREQATDGQSQRIQWQDAAARSRPERPAKGKAQASKDTDSAQANEQSSDDSASEEETADQDAAAKQPARSALRELPREALVNELIRRTRRSDAPPMRKAVTAVGLSLATNQAKLNQSLLSPLNTTQRQTANRFFDLNTTLATELLRTEGDLSRERVNQQVEMLFGEQPVNIQTLDLCNRVQGFGVYEPFDDHRFLSNQPNKIIVYTELDDFKSIKTENRYEVKLKQEVVLFNESDGLAVWSHDPVSIVDRSRNKRSDFFTVQLVTLPARLSVGKYRLKVRVTDVHGGTVDETTVPLEMVADRAMAQGQKRVK